MRTATAIALFSILLLCSCHPKDNAFPDKVTVTNSAGLKRIKGTRLFVKVPDSYTPVESLIRYTKNNDTYFQFMQIPGSNFIEHKPQLTKEAIEAQGAKVEVHKPFQYNGYEAIYMEGPSKTPGVTKLGIWFGNDKFVGCIIGVCNTNDKASIAELRNIFATSYFDSSYQLSPFEAANFKIDETITGFKHATTVGSIFVYTPDGSLKAIDDVAGGSGFQIVALEGESLEKILALLANMNNKIQEKGARFSNIQKRQIMIDGNHAIEITMDAEDQNGTPGKYYQAAVLKEGTTSAVIFVGADGDKGIYMDKFKATAQSIQFK